MPHRPQRQAHQLEQQQRQQTDAEQPTVAHAHLMTTMWCLCDDDVMMVL
jgi:hypothetical protein